MVGFVYGLVASLTLYDLTHEPDFPELGRYAIGIFLLAAIICKENGWEAAKDFIANAFMVGAGVALARALRRR